MRRYLPTAKKSWPDPNVALALLLNMVQSAELKYPLAEAVAFVIVIFGVVVEPVNTIGAVAVTPVTAPPAAAPAARQPKAAPL